MGVMEYWLKSVTPILHCSIAPVVQAAKFNLKFLMKNPFLFLLNYGIGVTGCSLR